MTDRPAFKIVQLAERPQHLDTVARWVWEHWRDHSRLSQAQTTIRLLDPAGCPATLLAEEGGVAVGVLGFQRFRAGARRPASLFIDALFVPEALRRRGIGGALAREGVDRARDFAPDLFVYTAQRDWYLRRGWSLLKVDPLSALFVLTRAT